MGFVISASWFLIIFLVLAFFAVLSGWGSYSLAKKNDPAYAQPAGLLMILSGGSAVLAVGFLLGWALVVFTPV